MGEARRKAARRWALKVRAIERVRGVRDGEAVTVAIVATLTNGARLELDTAGKSRRALEDELAAWMRDQLEKSKGEGNGAPMGPNGRR